MAFSAEHLLRRDIPNGRPWPLGLLLIASVMICLCAVTARVARAGGDAGRVHWTEVTGALVKLDGRTPLFWNVYQPYQKGRKKESRLILVLLGRRYLLLDLRATRVYAVLLSDLQAQGKDFESGDLAQASRLIPSSDWSTRDVGPAELIQLTLGDYGRVLTVQLPHPPDLRPFY